MPFDGAEVAQTPLPQVLEALADRLERQTAASVASLQEQAARLRAETAVAVGFLREQASRLRENQAFDR